MDKTIKRFRDYFTHITQCMREHKDYKPEMTDESDSFKEVQIKSGELLKYESYGEHGIRGPNYE